MKHIRQILLDKTALIRISFAESKGDPAEIALTKSRFEGLTDDEVQFLSIKEPYQGAGRFIGKIKIVGRDGFEFTQQWSPGDTVPVLHDKDTTTIPSLEALKKIIVPGKYFVEDINELCLVIKAGMDVEEIQTLLGFRFEPGELELRLKHLNVKSVIVDGSLPVNQITPNADGTLSDGTALEVTRETSFEGGFAANPFAPKQFVTVARTNDAPIMGGTIDKQFRAEFVGTYRNGEVIEGTLDDQNQYTLELDVANETTDDLRLKVNVGVDADKVTDVYSVEYVDEHWTIDQYTVAVDKPRAGLPLRFAGALTGAFTNRPWGYGDLQPKIVLTEVGVEPVEYDFLEDGTFDITHTPTKAGEMDVKFICGLPQDLNFAADTFTIMDELQLTDLVLGQLVADKTEVNADELVTLTSTLKSEDDLTMTSAQVSVMVDGNAVHQITPDEDGQLKYVYDVENDDLEPKVFQVKFSYPTGDSNIVEITVNATEQTPGRFEIILSEGELFKDGELRFKIYDTKDRPMVGTSGTWRREGGDPTPYVADGEEYVATISSPAGATEAMVESITLKCQALEEPVDFTWNLVIRFSEIRMDDGLPTSGVVGDPLLLSGLTLDQLGDAFPNVALKLFTNDDAGQDLTSSDQGVFQWLTNEDTVGEFVYRFEDAEGTVSAEHRVMWARVPRLNTLSMDSTYPTPIWTDETIDIAGRATDQYGDPYVVGEATLTRPDGTEITSALTETGYNFAGEAYIATDSLNQSYTVTVEDKSVGLSLTWKEKTPPVFNTFSLSPILVSIGEDYVATGEFATDHGMDMTGEVIKVTDDSGVEHDAVCDVDGAFSVTLTAAQSGAHKITATSLTYPDQTIEADLSVREASRPVEIDVIDEYETSNTFEGKTAIITGGILDQFNAYMETEVTATLDGQPVANTSADPLKFEFQVSSDVVATKTLTITSGVLSRDVVIKWAEIVYDITAVKFSPESVLQGTPFNFQGTLVSPGGGDVSGKEVELILSSDQSVLTTVTTEPDGTFAGSYTTNTPGTFSSSLRYGKVVKGPYTTVIVEKMVPTTVSGAGTTPITHYTNTDLSFSILVRDQRNNNMVDVEVVMTDELGNELGRTNTIFNGRATFNVQHAVAETKTYTFTSGEASDSNQVTFVGKDVATQINQIDPIDNDVDAGQPIAVKVELLNGKDAIITGVTPTYSYTGAGTVEQTGTTFVVTEATDGVETLTIESGDASLDVALTWAVAPPKFSSMELVNPPSTATVGEKLVLTLRTLDQYGDPIGGESVAVQYGDGDPSIRNSNSSGELILNIDGTEPGDVTYKFSRGTIPAIEHTVTWEAAVVEPVYSAIVVLSGETEGIVGQDVPVVVATVDQNGDPMPNQTIVWDNGGIPFPVTSSGPDGTKQFTMSVNSAGSVTYRFGDGSSNVTKATHTINWTNA
ncbi:putative hemagglutinin/hemolysin-related protein [Vibrio phage pTD1]|uniref:Putative hemagglutinin/hemolysin-related protein n=1 Tax=Vibrio phage pTD1 TaxID=1938577 RepID=A0A1Q2U2N8_9CAUD|nr:putative hemagglutinin/hemolysin-related protein [Vibrio phage pTD1]BAW98229.1 putative hemagglutinin/hemolysin-related protein [Vibrio phage pTD1]